MVLEMMEGKWVLSHGTGGLEEVPTRVLLLWEVLAMVLWVREEYYHALLEVPGAQISEALYLSEYVSNFTFQEKVPCILY